MSDRAELEIKLTGDTPSAPASAPPSRDAEARLHQAERERLQKELDQARQAAAAAGKTSSQPRAKGELDFSGFFAGAGGMTDSYAQQMWERIQAGKKQLNYQFPKTLEAKVQAAADAGKIKAVSELVDMIHQHFGFNQHPEVQALLKGTAPSLAPPLGPSLAPPVKPITPATVTPMPAPLASPSGTLSPAEWKELKGAYGEDMARQIAAGAGQAVPGEGSAGGAPGPAAPPPERFGDWEKYKGRHGGEGWRHVRTGKVRRQWAPAGYGEDAAPPLEPMARESAPFYQNPPQPFPLPGGLAHEALPFRAMGEVAHIPESLSRRLDAMMGQFEKLGITPTIEEFLERLRAAGLSYGPLREAVQKQQEVSDELTRRMQEAARQGFVPQALPAAPAERAAMLEKAKAGGVGEEVARAEAVPWVTSKDPAMAAALKRGERDTMGRGVKGAGEREEQAYRATFGYSDEEKAAGRSSLLRTIGGGLGGGAGGFISGLGGGGSGLGGMLGKLAGGLAGGSGAAAGGLAGSLGGAAGGLGGAAAAAAGPVGVALMAAQAIAGAASAVAKGAGDFGAAVGGMNPRAFSEAIQENLLRPLPLVGPVIADFAKALTSTVDGISATAERLSSFHGGLASARAQADVNQTFREIGQADRMGDMLAQFTMAQDALSGSSQELLEKINTELIPVVTGILEFVRINLDGVSQLWPVIRAGAEAVLPIPFAIGRLLAWLGMQRRRPDSDGEASERLWFGVNPADAALNPFAAQVATADQPNLPPSVNVGAPGAGPAGMGPLGGGSGPAGSAPNFPVFNF